MVASGYGGQTKLFTPRIRDMGHEVAMAANFGIQGATTFWDGMPVFSASADWGNNSISTFARHFKVDWVIALCDAWPLKPEKWDDDMRMAVWAPIDEEPIPPAVYKTLSDPKVQPIAMSRFGENWLRKAKLDPLYVPHGFDGNIYRPPTAEERSAARKVLEMPDDAFIVGMVGANRGWSPHAPRKAFPQAFDAFAQFAAKHKDAYFYVHSQAQPPQPGIDLTLLARGMGVPDDRVAFPPEVAWHLNVMDDAFVAGCMGAFDVLLNCSMSEGFGIPIIEAQACGTPVIASDCTSMPELTGSGWLVTGDRWWDGAQLAFAMMPSVGSILERLEEAYDNRGNQKLRQEAYEFAQTYEADRVAELYWKPALEALDRPKEVGPLVTNGKGIAKPMESRQARRARERKEAKAKA
jgi:glycosyltransferase involved in cell wall biosynthesis